MGAKDVNWHVALDPLRPMAVDPLTGGAGGPRPVDLRALPQGPVRGMQNALRRDRGSARGVGARVGRRHAPLVEELPHGRRRDRDHHPGLMTGAAKDAIDEARDRGKRVGLIKIKTFSPFPVEAIAARRFDGLKALGVVDRSVSFGWNCGPIYQDVIGALQFASATYSVAMSFIGGLAGADITTDHFGRVIERVKRWPRRPGRRAGLAEREGLTMEQTKYLIVGSSHAALSALQAIRMQDAEGSLTLVTRDDASAVFADRAALCRVRPLRARRASSCGRAPGSPEQGRLHPRRGRQGGARAAKRRTLRAAGDRLRASSCSPPARRRLPPIPGLEGRQATMCCARWTMRRLNAGPAEDSKQAVVLGAGLVGMHAAENLVKAGAQVTVVEMQPRVLAGYFDADGGRDHREGLRRQGRQISCSAQKSVAGAGGAGRPRHH
jgi:hypothetical protein